VTHLTNNILTAKGLDLLGTTVLAIADKSMDVSIGDSEV